MINIPNGRNRNKTAIFVFEGDSYKMIDQATIDRIMNAAQIVDVVSEFVTLRKRGVNYIGLCPFHDEKTPSFSVSPSKQICKCFSCGKGGNVVHFIMEHEQLNYYEALKFLAKKYNIEIQEKELTAEQIQARSTRESMFVVNNFARDYFADILKNHPNGKSIGLAYFRQRGFRDDTIAKFQLGYSIDARSGLANEALKKGFKKEFLVKTGLCYEADNGDIRDRFWSRVIFPVHTLSGKVVAFGGRTLNTENKRIAKYVNSPESEIYTKSNELYGIFFAKQAIVKANNCFLVEGYTDVISMHQAGVENVVSSSGTALTTGQIRLIHRFTDNITVLYDGDMAGIRASLRGIDMLLEEGMNVKVVLLPDGEDPDSFARKQNATSFQEYIQQNEKDFIRFKTSLLIDEAGEDPIKKAELIADIVKSISVIPEAIIRSVYIKETSQLLHISENILVAEVTKLKREELSKNRRILKREEAKEKEQQEEKSSSPRTSYIPTEGQEGQEFYKFERLIIQTIVRYGNHAICNIVNSEGEEESISVIEYIINDLRQDELEFYNPLHRTLLEESKRFIIEGHQGEISRFFLTHPNPEISRLAADLVSDKYQLSKYHTKSQTITTDEERLDELVPTLLINFKNALVLTEIKHSLQALQKPEIIRDPEKCNSLMEHYLELKQIQSVMAKKLGDRVIIPPSI